MPINCPACYPEPNACNGCRHNVDKKCRWSGTPVPLLDILTLEERVCNLEEEFWSVYGDLAQNIPSRASLALRKSMDYLKGQMLHLEGKLNEHIDRPKKERKKVKSEGLDVAKS